ncbi:reverse transcriptase domain-containing protein [Tanacetum coccineum]|uniref:Reverse transcriptase domain-containing protein n=1 Tax=Tanacetum coccineum TaxID=301880 RepID=A0ABQ5J1C7_9ASTR
MTTPVKKRNHTKFCEFYGKVRHNTDECMHLKKQIEEMLKAGKLSYLIKELKQNSGKEQPKTVKKGETFGKDKALAILMVQPWERVARQKIIQSFSPNTEILFPPQDEDEGTENQLVPATTPLIGFSGEIIWSMGQIQLLVRIGDEEHFASAWMNFVVVRSPSLDNRIIGRPGVKKLQAVPSMAHGMLKLLVEGGVITLQSSRLVLLECALVSGLEETPQAPKPMMEERGCSPVRQNKRGQAADRNQEIQEEVGKLVEAGIMKEVHYHDWLSNPVMTAEAEEAFKQMKQLIVELPMLTAPMEKKELIVYLVAAKETVSAVLMTEREAKQMPIYFVSRALRGSEINYTSMEKLVLVLVHASKQLKRYFQAHPIIVIMDQPIQPRVSVKGQILADFIVERPEEESPDTLMEAEEKLPEPKQVLVEELKEKSIGEVEILAIVEEEGDTWMTPIFKYLKDETLPADVKKARAVRRKSQRFTVINGTLYRKSLLGPWLQCVGPLQENYVLREIHDGSSSMHAGTQSVVAKALRIGYYWPTMHKDARALIRACQDCQVYKPVPRNPQQTLTPITSPWPFYKWGIDIVGPFLEGPRKVKILILAVDYFTKWIEAKPVATITGNQIKIFVWDNIVCRFGLPREIILDNGKMFRDNPFKDWHIKLRTAEVDLTQNGGTPFSLTYGTEAVIPVKIGMPILRTAEVDLTQNNEALGINLDLLEERREESAIHASRAEDTGKLCPKWEGPYEVTEALGKGAYKLRDCNGKQLS